MRRRNFLKTIAGVFGAAVVGVKITPAPIAPAASADILVSSAPAYTHFPRGLAYLVSNDMGCFQGLSRVSYPDMSAPSPDAHGPAITPDSFRSLKESLTKKADEAFYRGLECR